MRHERIVKRNVQAAEPAEDYLKAGSLLLSLILFRPSWLGPIQDAVVDVDFLDQIIPAELLSFQNALANQGANSRRGKFHFLGCGSDGPSFHGAPRCLCLIVRHRKQFRTP